MDDNESGLFHHHEGWVLDDGTQVDDLPTSIGGVAGGGSGNSQAEKPWVILLHPYLQSCPVAFCPSDRTPRSRFLARDLMGYNGGIMDASQTPPPNSELALARNDGLNIQSYLLNSVFTHKSARYAVEGVLKGFATEAAVTALFQIIASGTPWPALRIKEVETLTFPGFAVGGFVDSHAHDSSIARSTRDTRRQTRD